MFLQLQLHVLTRPNCLNLSLKKTPAIKRQQPKRSAQKKLPTDTFDFTLRSAVRSKALIVNSTVSRGVQFKTKLDDLVETHLNDSFHTDGGNYKLLKFDRADFVTEPDLVFLVSFLLIFERL